MILMLAPGPFISFGVCPSGLRYTSDQNGLVYVANNSAADQTALQDLGCSTLSPFGGWGTSFASLADLYAADASVTYNGVTGFPQYTAATVFDDATAGNNGTWAKTGIGTGAGSWTQVSAQTLATLASQIAAIDTEITALQTSLAMAGTSVFASVAAAQASGSLANGAYFYVPSATSGGALDFYLKNSSTSSTFIATIPALGNGLLPIFTPQMYANAANVPNTGGDSSAAINAAITAANTAGGGIVLLSAGVWNISNIEMKNGVMLMGSGRGVTILQSHGTPTAHLITATAAVTNITICDLSVDFQSTTANYSEMQLGAPVGCVIERVEFKNGSTILWVFQLNSSSTPFSNIEILDCLFNNCAGGGISFHSGVQGNRGIKIWRNVFNNVGGATTANCCQLGDVVADRGTGGCNLNVSIKENIWTNLSQFSICCEPASCTGLVFQGNILEGGSNVAAFGYSGGNEIDADISGNVITGFSVGIETGGTAQSNCHIHGNTLNSNSIHIFIDNAPSGTITNLMIEGNDFYGTGRSSYDSSVLQAAIAANDGTVTWDNLLIANNNFYDCEWLTALISIQGSPSSPASSITIKDNNAVGTTGNSTICFVNGFNAAQNTLIEGNDWLRTASITSSAWQGTEGYAGVFMHPFGSANGTQWVLDSNRINMQGTLDSGAYLTGTGNEQAATATYGLIISRNKFIGAFSGAAAVRVQTTTSDAKVIDNDVYGVTSAASTWYQLSSGVAASALPLLPCTVAALPSVGAVPVGTRGTVTDATSPTFLGALSGGGSTVTSVTNTASGWVSG